ncbi:MAG: Shikimate kinase [Bacteroidota bacterium]|jgi:shikimate kinase
MQKVVLTGYMGAGKSVVAEQLAQKIQCKWIDLDHEIEKSEGVTLAKLFETKGELYFRKREHELFIQFLSQPEPVIISTGGGTPCYYNNHEYLQLPDVASFYLKASIATLVHRLQTEQDQRPLLANLNADALQEYIAKHLFDRNFYYLQSKYSIVVDDKSVAAIVSEIEQKLT